MTSLSDVHKNMYHPVVIRMNQKEIIHSLVLCRCASLDNPFSLKPRIQQTATMPMLVIFLALVFCCQAQPNLPGPLMPPIGKYLPTQQLKLPVRVLGLKRLFLTLSLLDQRNSLRNDVPLRILEFCVRKKTKPFIPCLLDLFKQIRSFQEFHPIRG